MKCMIVVNLHETEFLEEVLTILAEAGVLDCVVNQVECIASHHTGEQLEPRCRAPSAGSSPRTAISTI